VPSNIIRLQVVPRLQGKALGKDSLEPYLGDDAERALAKIFEDADAAAVQFAWHDGAVAIAVLELVHEAEDVCVKCEGIGGEVGISWRTIRGKDNIVRAVCVRVRRS
jgi:hypothetical protein